MFFVTLFSRKNSTGDTCAFVLSTSKIKVSRYFYLSFDIYYISTKMWLYDNWLNYLVLTEKSYLYIFPVHPKSSHLYLEILIRICYYFLKFQIHEKIQQPKRSVTVIYFYFFRHNRQSNLLQILNLTGKILLVRCYESVNSLHKMILYAFSECFFLV